MPTGACGFKKRTCTSPSILPIGATSAATRFQSGARPTDRIDCPRALVTVNDLRRLDVSSQVESLSVSLEVPGPWFPGLSAACAVGAAADDAPASQHADALASDILSRTGGEPNRWTYD